MLSCQELIFPQTKQSNVICLAPLHSLAASWCPQKITFSAQKRLIGNYNNGDSSLDFFIFLPNSAGAYPDPQAQEYIYIYFFFLIIPVHIVWLVMQNHTVFFYLARTDWTWCLPGVFFLHYLYNTPNGVVSLALAYSVGV